MGHLGAPDYKEREGLKSAVKLVKENVKLVKENRIKINYQATWGVEQTKETEQFFYMLNLAKTFMVYMYILTCSMKQQGQ